MFQTLGRILSRYALAVLIVWLLAVIGLRWFAPAWSSITQDGDFAYLPASMPSVRGEAWLEAAFPTKRAKSQMVLLVSRRQGALDASDMQVAYDVARRFKNLYGARRLAQALELREQITEVSGAPPTVDARASSAVALSSSPPSDPLPPPPAQASLGQLEQAYRDALDQAELACDEAIRFDQLLDRLGAERPRDRTSPQRPRRLFEAFHNFGLVARLKGDTKEAQRHAAIAKELAERQQASLTLDQPLPLASHHLPILDVWTWHEDVFGSKLTSVDKSARLVILQLSNEFMAVENIPLMELVEQQIEEVETTLSWTTSPGLSVGISGSAAVGADLLRASHESIRHTEVFTIVLVLVILALIYRSPLLVVVPLVTLALALLSALGLVASYAEISRAAPEAWWSLRVFTTTRIFIVVILFGAGTDYCLFLISRYREELAHASNRREALARSVARVGDALVASALTTILGIGTMYFAQFGKYSNSGPIIGICLLVTLIACLSFAPSLLNLLGMHVFWPSYPRRGERLAMSGRNRRVWHRLANFVVRRPWQVLGLCLFSLTPLALFGYWLQDAVTYDILSELAESQPSKRGAAELKRHFPIGESGPVTVLIRTQQDLTEQQSHDPLRALADEMYVEGVATVRSSADPLGQYGPGEKPSLLSARGRQLRVLRAHPRTRAIFVAEAQEFAGRLARFEVILESDPFSATAIEVVDRLETALRRRSEDPESFWFNAEIAFAGTTAAIRDLKEVTTSDRVRIQVLCVTSVLAVLLLILRRPAICMVMIVSVVFSFYVTLGATWLFFYAYDGSTFNGLDWKVPLFLFVILVAVGQDYNVYLATRMLEEQRQRGPFTGLRYAIIKTGGIISSCGVIMAGTFFAMTSGAWGVASQHALRGMIQLGFALTLGILVDTFIIRSLLVPACFALLGRFQVARQLHAESR